MVVSIWRSICCDAAADLHRVAGAVDDDGVLLGDLDLVGLAEHGDVGVLELHADVGGNDLTAGEDGDILQHLLAPVAEAGGLDAHAGEGAAQLVEHDGGQGLALDVLGDDQELAAGLDDLLEQGQDILDVGDLLVGDEDERVVDDGLHLVGIGDHVGGEVAAVKLHALDHIAVGLGGLALLDGDDAVLADLLHGLGDQGADQLVAGGDGADAGDVLGAGHGDGDLLHRVDGGGGGLLDALLHDHGVCARGEVLQTLGDHGLREHGGGGGAVAGDVVGLGGDFLDHLGAHVLKGVLKLDLLGDGHAVVGDQGRAELLVQNDVAALGAEGDLHGVGQLVDAALDRFSCFFAVNNLLSHCCFLLEITRSRPECRTGGRWCTPDPPA